VGHSFGADICLYFALRYPDRVSKLAALEPGMAALVGTRKEKNWPGWAYWVRRLEEVGVTVPEDKRTDLDYLFAVSLETPKFYGPARGLPRNRKPLLHLIRNTTLIRDYEHVGELTLEAVERIQTETLLIYGEHSHFLPTLEFLRRRLPNSRSILLPGGEHFGPLEQPQLLVQHMTAFFEEGRERVSAMAAGGGEYGGA
jgi:pimeloyl-ACP methyl ester carboxylesterase